MKLIERVEYLKMALALSGFVVDDLEAELICEYNDYISQTKGKANLRDILKIKTNIIAKHDKLNTQFDGGEQ